MKNVARFACIISVAIIMPVLGCWGTDTKSSPDAGTISCKGKADGTTCTNPSVNPCIERGVCMGGTCMVSFAPAGTACGDIVSNDCTKPDTCDGAGVCQANHELLGTACGDSSKVECSESDTCNGAGSCSPNHKVAGTACGNDTDTQCTNADSCDDRGQCADNHEMDGKSCTDCPGGGGCDSCSAGVCTGDCASAPRTLSTLLAYDDAHDGTMFDITAGATDIKITSFDVNLRPTATPHDVEIYYRVGSYAGFDNDSSGWTKAGRADDVISAGTDVATSIPIDLGVNIPAGATYGFYVVTVGSGGVYYSAGSQEGRVYISDANISIREGIAVGYPFLGQLGTVYVFNGNVHYQTCP
jgi:hypothetical protein